MITEKQATDANERQGALFNAILLCCHDDNKDLYVSGAETKGRQNRNI